MPVSTFIVAPFEQGKTRLAMENCPPGESLIVSDLTGIGILEQLQMNPSATTLVINDLTAVVGHRQNVNRLTVSILNALAEEGCYKIAMPQMIHLDLRGRKVNVIACCAPEVVSDRRNWWYKSGFMSRLLTVRFEHSVTLQLKIHQAIQSGDPETNPTVLRVPMVPIPVDFPERESAELSSLSTHIYKQYEETGYRKHKQIRSLAAGHALMRTWKKPKIEQDEIRFVESCTPFFLDGSKI